MRIEDTIVEIERFYEAASTEPGFESYPEVLKPSTDQQIAALLDGYGLKIPDDVRKFWERGIKYRSLSVDFPDSDRSASAYFDWLQPDQVARNLQTLRETSKDMEGVARQLLESGFPLTHSQPELIVGASGQISHFSTRNQFEPPVAHSLAEFLEHWLEAGCFSSHAITNYFPRIRHLVPGRIPPEKNLWIIHYRKYYPEYA